jgi:hypothetical protein
LLFPVVGYVIGALFATNEVVEVIFTIYAISKPAALLQFFSVFSVQGKSPGCEHRHHHLYFVHGLRVSTSTPSG